MTSYCQSLAAYPSEEEIPRRALDAPEQILKNADLTPQETQRWRERAHKRIRNQLAYLRDHKLLCSEDVLVTSMDEEPEREREQEKEQEKEVEIETKAEVCPPPVQAHTQLVEKQWEWGHALQKVLYLIASMNAMDVPVCMQ